MEMRGTLGAVSAIDAVGYGPSASAPARIVIVGCGNLLRGDDGVGPVLIRELFDCDLPLDVALVDGGTAGMDVAFKMRSAREVILIDASSTGAVPGTLFRLPGEEVERLPPIEGIHSHAYRWDHALAMARWLLGEEYPERVTVYLIEAENLGVGDRLSESVSATKDRLRELLVREIDADRGPVAADGG
ncbi:MAG: hydrogenase maturation protease [Ferrimicrobium sp.]